MTTEQKLQRIRDLCEKRIKFYDRPEGTFPHIPECLLESAVDGWHSTIAAIDGLLKASQCWSTTADALASQNAAKQQLKAIITAWEGQP
jgi:hypothetical protein